MSSILGEKCFVILHKFQLKILCIMPIDKNTAAQETLKEKSSPKRAFPLNKKIEKNNIKRIEYLQGFIKDVPEPYIFIIAHS